MMAVTVSTLLPLYLVFQLNQEERLVTSSVFDQAHAGNELVLKIPIALPYAENWNTTLEEDGLFQDGDHFYTVVSKRYEMDTLYVTYLENTNAREIFNLLSDHFEDSTTKDQSPGSSGTLISKLLRIDYFRVQPVFHFQGLVDDPGKLSVTFPPFCNFYQSALTGTLAPPPDLI